MERRTEMTPGRDCISVLASCPHEPNCRGTYGRHGEEWRYISIANDKRSALELTIYTDIFPDGSPLRLAREHEPLHERRYGADLSLHVADPRGAALCPYVEDRPCSVEYTTAMGARDFFRTHGDPRRLEQNDDFWRALEMLHEEIGVRARARIQRADAQRRMVANIVEHLRSGGFEEWAKLIETASFPEVE